MEGGQLLEIKVYMDLVERLTYIELRKDLGLVNTGKSLVDKR
jgi:hypothetical protein